MKEPVMHRLVLLAVVAALLFAGLADARLIEPWPYKRLLEEADVVVIATALSSKDNGEVTKFKSWETEFLGVETTFTVEVVLKGKLEGDKLTVLHYRLKGGTCIVNGPLLVSFRTRGIMIRTKEMKAGLGRPSYLLFLKKTADGRYEAVSGQVDPALAVREMFHPLPAGLGKEE
jgi:hypothetical protein